MKFDAYFIINRMKNTVRIIFFLLLIKSASFSQSSCNGRPVLPGAARVNQYIDLLKNKRVAIFANQTSMVEKEHLVDILTKKNIRIEKIFAPEHGFRGTADAGEKVGNIKDPVTGIPVISLYGKKTKPSAEDLKDIDIMLFDIQDIGVRFYTYISSLEDYMEAAIENNKSLIILDRPNPNGFYVDGPVLDKKFRSFIGMQPVPVVYGMTIGEYAKMLIGEKWLSPFTKEGQGDSALYSRLAKADIKVIPCANYTHKSKYTLPVKPSPNLPDMSSIYLYPSTCFFEGTVLSEGRGTDKPFQLFGHPSLPKNLVSFTPHSKEGAKDPKLRDQLCYGWDLSGTPEKVLKKVNGKIQLKWLLAAYRLFPDKKNFFLSNGFFNNLAGNDVLMKQIKEGKTEAAIRESWQPLLKEFKKIRKKYLLYPDFE
jgi:uncharacterized protein YbbC (DUF1343 family)